MIIAHCPRIHDAGMLGLAIEIRKSSTAELIEQRDLLAVMHPALQLVARPRLRLVVDELARRGGRPPLRLLTPAELMSEYGS